MNLFRITGYDDRHLVSASWRDHPRGKCLFVCVGPHLFSHVFGRVESEPASTHARRQWIRPHTVGPAVSFLMACAAGMLLVLVAFAIVVGLDKALWGIR